MIWRADEWLLDRVAQPVANALAGAVSPLAASRWALLAGNADILTFKVARHGWELISDPWEGFSILALLSATWVLLSVIRHNERRLRPGRLNQLRADWRPYRVMMLIILAINLLLQPWPVVAASLAYLVSAYIGSCEDQPPMRHAPQGAGA